MSCCIEDAVLETLRGLNCTTIKSENHFLNEKRCSDCLPYVVVKIDTQSGLRTSSAVQKSHTVDIKAYFSDTMQKKAQEYRALVEDWLFAAGCVTLGSCGCFCQRGNASSSIRSGTGGVIVYSLVFRGTYKQSGSSDSVSASESV